MQMLGPLDGIGPGELKLAVVIGGGLLKGGLKALTKTYSKSLLGHIFRDAVGHVNPATAASQARYMELFESVAANPANLRTNFPLPTPAANAGVQAFTRVFRNGNQV